MRTLSHPESRTRHAETLDAVANDREEVVITRAGKEPVVMVSLDGYRSLKDVAYLRRSPANGQRVLAATDRLEAGPGTPRRPVE